MVGKGRVDGKIIFHLFFLCLDIQIHKRKISFLSAQIIPAWGKDIFIFDSPFLRTTVYSYYEYDRR